MKIDDLKISTKILLIMGMMGLVTALVIGVSSIKMLQIDKSYSDLVEHKSPAMVEIARANRNLNSLAYAGYRALAYGAGGEGDKAKADAAKALESARGDLAEAEALTPEKAALYADFDRKLNNIGSVVTAGIDAALAGDAMNATLKMQEADTLIPKLVAELREANEVGKKENAAKAAANTAAVKSAIFLSAVVGFAGLGLSVLAGLWIARGKIAGPLIELSTRMQRLATGDLTVDIDGQTRRDEVGAMAKSVQVFKDNGLRLRAAETEADRHAKLTDEERRVNEARRAADAAELARVVTEVAGGLDALSQGNLTHFLDRPFAGEYEKLRTDFNGAIKQLRETMTVIGATTQGVRSGAGEITQASDDLSRRTEQQAASLEETAAALDQITATVRRTAEGAAHARGVVNQAKESAQRSGRVVEDAIAAMGEIASSSSQIGSIIGVIDEIAFQTNLLALNAGVEAARAGDAGKGFAVVASEVRALAQRSAEAAKEIKALISASSQQVSSGVELVGGAGQALSEIAAQVAEITGIVSEIAASAQEQATGLHQVNIAVNQMDQVTQQNAAMVEQSTAAAHSLSREGSELAALVSQFRTDEAAPVASRHGRSQPIRSQSRGEDLLRSVGHGRAAVAQQLQAAVQGEWEDF